MMGTLGGSVVAGKRVSEWLGMSDNREERWRTKGRKPPKEAMCDVEGRNGTCWSFHPVYQVQPQKQIRVVTSVRETSRPPCKNGMFRSDDSFQRNIWSG